jgi:hypothetical protein
MFGKAETCRHTSPPRNLLDIAGHMGYRIAKETKYLGHEAHANLSVIHSFLSPPRPVRNLNPTRSSDQEPTTAGSPQRRRRTVALAAVKTPTTLLPPAKGKIGSQFITNSRVRKVTQLKNNSFEMQSYVPISKNTIGKKLKTIKILQNYL